MKSLNLVLPIAALMVLTAIAPAIAGKGDKSGAKGEKKKTELQSLNLTGTVISAEKEYLGKDGELHTKTVYYLKTENGNVSLPEHQGCKKDKNQVRLKDFDGSPVTIVARGLIKSGKDGKMHTYVHQIVNIQRVASEAPAAT